MGLIRGEGRLLKEKYMKKYGLSQYEATDKVSEFIDDINETKAKMKAKKKSDKEIELKLQSRFEEEFQRLCCE